MSINYFSLPVNYHKPLVLSDRQMQVLSLSGFAIVNLYLKLTHAVEGQITNCGNQQYVTAKEKMFLR